MQFNSSSFQTSVGKKVIMAITGTLLIGFVIMHMLGNLQIFAGPDKINAYAKFLKDLGPLLWVARIGLIVIFITHLTLGIKLRIENAKSRPIPYFNQQTKVASIASRTMAQTGVMILAFLIYHILHFTLGVTNPDQYCIHDSMGRHHVFNMVVLGFQNIFVSSAYIVGQFFLAVHISHAFFSIFQTIGFNHPQFDPKLKLVSNLLAFVIFVGNSSMPIAVLLNFIQLSTGGAC